ncbi:MAG: right-handed parallel beta-helix repeat-containing protein [Alphaproteobacteria bacterium]|nr:right-handed parallel beta-helix repeat-containing protein [Alphaproteobacteria bacterium]
MSIRTTQALLAAGAAVLCSMHPASARMLQVGTCKPAQAHFDTIQQAVNAAFNGDTVSICPGTYPEQVSVAKALTLTNVKNMANPLITIPAGGAVQNGNEIGLNFPVAAQILVAPPSTPTSPMDVTIRNVVVDGAGNEIHGTCGLDLVGIYYKNAGGAIQGTTEQNQLLPPDTQGCQNGLGILVENQTAGTHTITIAKNTVKNFDKNGITIDYAEADADISGNVVTGNGPIDYIAQNGIQVAYGARASITSNTLTNLIYSPGTYGSAGIILYDLQASETRGPSSVGKNTIDSAQYGVVLDAAEGTAGHPVSISRNTISNSQFAGVGLYSDNYYDPPKSNDYIDVSQNTIQNTSVYDGIDACSDHNTITKNKIGSSNEAGVHLDGLCTEPDGSQSGKNNSVSGNKISVACVGILSGPAEGENNIGNNKYAAVQNNIVYDSDDYTCGSPAHAPRHAQTGHKKGGIVPGALSPMRRVRR